MSLRPAYTKRRPFKLAETDPRWYYVRRNERLWGRKPRRVVGGGPPNTHAMASRALSLIRKFNKREEVKLVEGFAATIQIPIAGNWIVDGFGPYTQQGTTLSTRIGNKITVISLAMRWLIKVGNELAPIRLVICYDRRPLGADATSSDLFVTDNQINSGYFKYGTNKGRFQVLLDKTYSTSQLVTASSRIADKMYWKGALNVDYSGNAGTVADLDKGNFLIMAMSEGNGVAIDIDYGYSFRFTDF